MPDPRERRAAAPEPGVAGAEQRGAADRALAGAAFDAQRTDALAYLAQGIAHDLANPLGAMLAFASYLASDPRLPVDLREDARQLRLEADRTQRMVRTLLEFARNRPPSVAPVALDVVMGEIFELQAYVLSDIEVERDVPDDLPLAEVDPSRLRHLLLVVSVEAIRRLGDPPAKGRLRTTASASGSGMLRIELAFEREAGRPVPASPDLGPASSLARDLGGALRAEESSTGGRFTLELPTSEAARETAPDDSAARRGPRTASVAADPGGVHPTVLICDDEATIRSLIVRILEKGGFRTLQAASAPEALSLITRAPIDVVLTDHHMQGMSGIDLFEQAVAARPDLRDHFVVMTGEPGADDLVDFASGTGVTILAKPFELQALAAIIREVAS